MKFLAIILVAVAFISAFVYAVGLIFGKKEEPKKSTPLDDLDEKADRVVKARDAVETEADEVEKKAASIKSKVGQSKK